MSLRLAVLQSPGALDGVDARLDWLETQLARLRADLVLLPELFACGYNISGLLRDRAEPRDGPAATRIAALARAHGIAICYGYAEAGAAALYNAAQCFGPDGAVLAHQRKLAIPPGFERDVFTPGAACTLFDLAGLRLAILICYDAEFPETVRHVAAQRAQLVLVPTALGADWGWVADSMIPVRAYENGVWLAYANHAGAENGLTYLGRSVIAAPGGVEAARAGDGPQPITATITADAVEAAQARLPYLSDRSRLKL
ncbi:carbon-nitrogen hydrolase family protein [Aestuariicoccus sp. MJ-SS9]|uniref:carbon-nitrogen hydrolase family protein n=1 Tax=Aestuariicoccus sp. MJ-SS9 TaxID=3079855 RepID=UPI00290FCF9C|nr:carbon-nitrogen hydrolase family protein [Aestuariicoccus sp. MJ-SS9]MDU8910690.1 carbon-nitrogen hydrolase family protein [Aestuariicoccus sp. MJ-SS9]